MRRLQVTTLVAALIVALGACTYSTGPGVPTEHPVPVPAPAKLSGTVTLNGSGNPSESAGVRVMLFSSYAAYEVRAASYAAPLRDVPGSGGTYVFEFENIAPGAYYVVACFTFGCGDWRHPSSGELLRISIEPARRTFLHFGV